MAQTSACHLPLLYAEFHVDRKAKADASFDCISERSQPHLIRPLLPSASSARPQLSGRPLQLRVCTGREHGGAEGAATRPWWDCVEGEPDGVLLEATNSNHLFQVVRVFGALLSDVPDSKDGDVKSVVVTEETFVRLVLVGEQSPSASADLIALYHDITPASVNPSSRSPPPWTWGAHSDPFLHSLMLAPYPSELVAEVKLRLERMVYLGDEPARQQHHPPRGVVGTSFAPSSDSFVPLRASSALPLSDGGLLIYDSVPGSGKTVLAANVAAQLSNTSKNAAVYLVQCSKLISTEPLHAPLLLATIVHSIALQNAVRGKAAIVILDKIECIIPRQDLFPPNSDVYERSMKNDLGDPVVATLHTLSSLLHRLSSSLPSVPFPPLNASSPSSGSFSSRHSHLLPSPPCLGTGASFAFPGLALVAVLTLPPAARALPSTIAPAAIAALGGGSNRMLLPASSGKQLVQAFKSVLKLLYVTLGDEVDDKVIVAHTARMKGGDFIRAAQEIKSRGDTTLMGVVRVLQPYSDSSDIFLRVAPPAASSVPSSPMAPRPSSSVSNPFELVGGNAAAKTALLDALALSGSKRRRLARMGVGAPIGVLLHGPPGTGKTMLARAAAEAIRKGDGGGGRGDDDGDGDTRSGAFVMLRASEVVMGEVGSSEKIVVEAFETVRRNGGGVIFIDEFQALFVKRGGNEGGGKLASVLLECMDEVKTCEMNLVKIAGAEGGGKRATRGRRIVVLAATNSVRDVDPAFLRPGRFDCVVHVGLPGEEERKEILWVIVRKMKVSGGEQGGCGKEEIARKIAELTEGFSGADLQQLCNAAALKCIAAGEEKAGVTLGHFETCLKERKPKKKGALGMEGAVI